MKQAAIIGEKLTSIRDTAEPELREGWALVKIHAAPMCAEYKGFLNGHISNCLGHEAAGEVVKIASGSRLKVGDRVVVMPQYPCGECQLCLSGDYIYCEHNLPYTSGTMAQYIAKPSWILPKIPDGVSYDKASLACCALGPSHGAYGVMGVDAFSTVLITGLGPVGLGAIVTAKYRGAQVIAVEMNEYRIELARKLGVDHIIDPRDEDAISKIKALTGGNGPHYGLDCSGVVSAHRLLIDAVRRKGKVAFVGECHKETPIRISDDMLRKGIHLIGSWHYNLNEFNKIMEIIKTSTVTDDLITHTFPLSHIQEAFEVSASGRSGKIIVKPWE
ncbi:zinc-dependent alcohol dehydrogenase [Paenibacillus qinlingensis]|uniref:zinc-dependent alcohol dehydrogenase n=1 Tax=Paenibacillus qinlingensis TaxID=1837343 RepID=UPI0015654107|nr:zinc-binding dehydrogenase [Paenibacillus qinlingensis]NQX60740.1 zinc-binding dehydrogenase [Paenibacillus qinlingensis]